MADVARSVDSDEIADSSRCSSCRSLIESGTKSFQRLMFFRVPLTSSKPNERNPCMRSENPGYLKRE